MLSVEFGTQPVSLLQLIAEQKTQTIVENDIIVPDAKEDISNVILIDGEVFIKSLEVSQDKIILNGIVYFNVLYVSNDDKRNPKSINTSVIFSYKLDIPNVRQGMRCNVICNIEHIDYDILNDRKLNVRTIMNISTTVIDEVNIDIINELKSETDIQFLNEMIDINYYMGSREIDQDVKESMQVPENKPSIKEILRHDLRITGKEYKITYNKVIVKCELHISTMYIGDDEKGSCQLIEHEIPFSQSIDFPEIDEDIDSQLELKIIDWKITIEEDSDGELRVLNGDFLIHTFVECSKRKTIEVISDAYSRDYRLNFEKKQVKSNFLINQSKGQINLKESIIIPSNEPQIGDIINIICKATLQESKVFDERIVLEGLAITNILYYEKDTNFISCYKYEIPFKHVIELKNIKLGMNYNIYLNLENFSYNLFSSNEVEVKIVIGAFCSIINDETVFLTTNVDESLNEEHRDYVFPSITIYFSQPGDTIWKIAKNYCSNIDNIRAINGSLNSLDIKSLITPGQQIIIPRRNN